MNDNSATLLPCPFCGGEARVVDVDPTPHYVAESHWVLCGTCKASSMTSKDRDETIEWWNRRVEVMAKDTPKNPSGYGMKLTSEEIEQAVAEMRGTQMNNLQHIVKDNNRFAMHMAVELCERGDFDSVNEALRWLMKERDDVATPSGGERIASLERSLEHYRLEVVCYENDVDARDRLICDMHRELRDLNDGGISTDCMEYEQRMRELGIEEER